MTPATWPNAHVGGPGKARQNQTLQLRIAGWHQACRFATCLDQAGYHFTKTDSTRLHPGEYTGRPLLAAPDQANQSRPWLVAWQPFKKAPRPKPDFAAEVARLLSATMNKPARPYVTFGLLLSALGTAALVLRLGLVLPHSGRYDMGLDLTLLSAGVVVAIALFLAGLGELLRLIARGLGHALALSSALRAHVGVGGPGRARLPPASEHTVATFPVGGPRKALGKRG